MSETLPSDINHAARCLWDFHRIAHDLTPAEAIVGLGSYDLRVADRCAALYHQKLAPLVLFTGASGNWTKGLYAASEAEAFAERAQSNGVPESVILVETKATNIGENIQLSKALLAPHTQVIFVTKPQTTHRCLSTVRKQWPDCDAQVTCPETGFDTQPTSTHTKTDLIHEMVGDLWRLKTYPALGFQIEVTIPKKVEAAFDLLKQSGFTNHLPKEVD